MEVVGGLTLARFKFVLLDGDNATDLNVEKAQQDLRRELQIVAAVLKKRVPMILVVEEA